MTDGFSTTAAAAVLGVSRQRVLQLIWSDLLPAEKRGRDWWIDAQTLAAYRPRKPGRPAGRKNNP